MEKLEIIIRLLESLNQGNSGYAEDRIERALLQYAQLVAAGLLK